MQSQLNAGSEHIFVTKDFLSVAELAPHDGDDDFLRPVWWIAQIVEPNNADVLVLLSPFECNALLPTFRSSTKSVLHMFCSKLSLAQSHLLNDKELQLPANSSNKNIDASKTVQISMFAGSMYFNHQHEEKSYCDFMGFIPRQQSAERQQEFEEGVVTCNGDVPVVRHHFSKTAKASRFTENPDKIAIGIIERRYGYLSAKSHVSSLLVEGKRVRWNS